MQTQSMPGWQRQFWRRVGPMLGCLAVAATHCESAQARGYSPDGLCGDFARVKLSSPAGTCVALVADELQGLRFPRRILEVAPNRYWVVDMGSWEHNRGRLLEMSLPTTGTAPRRATVTVLAEGLDRPLGLALGPDGKVYVAEADKIWRSPVAIALQRETVIDHLPSDGAHPLKEIAFGTGGRLYVNVGSFSDACRSGAVSGAQTQPLPCPESTGEAPRAAVYQAILGGANFSLQSFKPFATGLRNSVALTVMPDGPLKGRILQGENSIDYPDENQPPEELNQLLQGRHYGWPYCVGNRQPARGYEGRFDCRKTEAPLMLWPAHVAPLHLLVGPLGSPFAGQLLVAWHGYKPAGQRVVGYTLDVRGKPLPNPVQWMAGWDAKPGLRPLGKPTGLAVDSQGRLLVVEDINRSILMLLHEPAGLRPKNSAK